jgi:peptidyl-prolyl cis-trans isomerase B (cyclophilin B)
VPNSRQRREAERRRLQRQLQRRVQREARRRRAMTLISVVGVLAIVAVIVIVVAMNSGGGTKKPAAGAVGSSTAAVSTSASPSKAAPAYPCTWTKTGSAARTVKVPSTTTPPKTGVVSVAVSTSQGPMTFTLDRAKAPCAVASFVSLAQQKYFDNTSCHRLTSGTLSVLQCGDPTGTGSGGPGYQFGDEVTGSEKYTRGALAMANAGPNTNGSQFFVVYKDSQLGPNYTIFGSVSKGLGVVDRVAAKGSNPAGDGKPKLPIKIEKVIPGK